MTHFEPIRDDDARVSENVLEDGKRAFVADQWHIVKSRDGETIYLGTESVLLQTGLLLTKAEYAASAQHSVTIEGFQIKSKYITFELKIKLYKMVIKFSFLYSFSRSTDYNNYVLIVAGEQSIPGNNIL